MKFHQVIGDLDKNEVEKANDALNKVITELALSANNPLGKSGLGGDAFLYALMFPVQHICCEELAPGQPLATAATDGVRFYWNPKFVNSLSILGLRLVMLHEGWHAVYMHPKRRGRRLPHLWNIAVDFKVNNIAILDLRSRKQNQAEELFQKNLGDYVTLSEYAQYLKDPFNPPEKLKQWKPSLTRGIIPKDEKQKPLFYAEPNLPDDLQVPEKIYDYLLNQMPKCPDCNARGYYKFPDDQVKREKKEIEDYKKNNPDKKEAKSKDKKDSGKDKDDCQDQSCDSHDHDHNDEGNESQQDGNQPGNQPGNKPGKEKPKFGIGSCGTCGSPQFGDGSQHGQKQDGQGEGQGQGKGQPSDGTEGQQLGDGTSDGKGGYYFDKHDGFGLVDQHIDSTESQEEQAKKIADAIDSARRLAGTAPSEMEGELGKLLAPKLTWEDFIRIRMKKRVEGHKRSDWTKPRIRPLFAGLYVPRKMDYHANILLSYDCSGSMSDSDICYGISQVAALKGRASGWAVGWDTQAYFDKKHELKSTAAEELVKIKRVACGGTMVNDLFNRYQKEVGDVDIIVCITDGYLADTELRDCKVPKNCDVIWLITSDNSTFSPPFGRVFHIRND